MNYYEHHIGDYAEATAHLSFVEDAAYSRMIRKYYSTEKPLPADVKAVQRLVGARTSEERAAVQTCLDEFFKLQDDGWHQKRCDSDLARFQQKQEKARASAQARWSKPQSETDANAMRTHDERISERMPSASQTHNERNALQTPDTRHQTPDVESSTQPSQPRERTARASRLPPGWQPSEALLSWAKAEKPGIDILSTVDRFVDFWISKSGKDGTKLDWDATFRNWVRNERPRVGQALQSRSFQQQNADAAAARVAEFAPGVAARSALPQLTIIEGESHVKRIN